MGKLKSLDELKKMKEQALSNTNLRITGENPNRTVIMVGMATCGIVAGAKSIMEALLDEISKRNLENISVVATDCLGDCHEEPLVEVRVPGMEAIRYGSVTADKAREIIKKHIIEGVRLDNAMIGQEVRKSESI